MRQLTPEHAARRAASVEDKTSMVTSRGMWFRMQYELEDALIRTLDLEQENTALRARLAILGRNQELE